MTDERRTAGQLRQHGQHSGCVGRVARNVLAAGHIVGVLGVIGPTRLNYARVIPTVDYAARIVSRMLGG